MPEIDPEDYAQGSLGFGVGLDYGGIGARISGKIVTQLYAFAGVGYNLNGAGFNGGAVFRFSPKKRVCPILSAMYGYNAVIIVEGMKEQSKTYYGPSFGGGIELKVGRKSNFFVFELWVPVRSQEYRDDIDALLNNAGVEVTEATPVAISVGYNFRF